MTESEHLQRNESARARLERELRQDTMFTAVSVFAVVVTAGVFLWLAGVLG